VSVQAGAGIADRLFSQLPPASLTTLRLWSAALIMVIVGGRPAARVIAGLARQKAWRDTVSTGSFGITLGFMNFAIYQSFARIPLGVAVTIEFLGPLAVTVSGAVAGGAGRRRVTSLAWAALAAAGVVSLTRGAGGHLNLSGVAWAVAAGAAWAGYIVGSKAAGRRLPGSSGLVIAMCVAAVVVTPGGVLAGGTRMFAPALLAAGAAIGLLSSVIPYWLELEALRRVETRVFGVWMSMQPAVAALIGLALLGQRLRAAEWAGICCVVAASAGAAQTTTKAGSVTMGRVYSWLARIAAPVFAPTTRWLRRFALASMISNAVVISTGAAVRLSSSGLGCPDWPDCTKSSVVAAHSTGQTTLNTWIEFGNRLLNFPLVLIAGLTFIAFLMWHRRQRAAGAPGRRDLVRLSAILPLGVIAQAVVGGIVVLTRLNPALVAAHFLLSTAIILTAAVVLHARTVQLAAQEDQGAERTAASRGDDPPYPPTAGPMKGKDIGPAISPVRVDLRVLAGLLTAITALMLAAGTIVTGTGPLAGTTVDSHGHRTTVPRFHFSLESVTQLHADIGWFIGALTVALVIGLRYSGASRRTVRLGWMVLCGLGLQGVIGYVQYFNHLPAGLVWVHVAGSVLIWIFVLQLYLSTAPTESRAAESVALASPETVPAP
jgi:threonine/homoserine efflux transporter RhtA/heme A synthase